VIHPFSRNPTILNVEVEKNDGTLAQIDATRGIVEQGVSRRNE
jgi:hypothetical protein